MKNDFVYSLNDKERKRYQLYALFSTFFGCFSDVMVDSSAILILYFAMLGADKSTVMSSTGYVAIASMLLMIPASGLVNKLGAKSVVAISSVIGMSSCLLMAAAPFFGREWACNIALVGCFAYSISKATWPVAWYVVLGNILLPSERGNFLGFMRFSYYILTGVVFWAVGYAMGSNPPEWFLQAVISVIGVMILGRTLFISMIKLPEEKTKTLELGKSFKSVIKNYALIGFSVYVCFICLAFAAVLPLTLIYMKEGLAMGDGLVQEISAFGIGGLVFGYFVYGRLVRLAGIRNVQLLVHAIYIATPLGLFFCSPLFRMWNIFPVSCTCWEASVLPVSTAISRRKFWRCRAAKRFDGERVRADVPVCRHDVRAKRDDAFPLGKRSSCRGLDKMGHKFFAVPNAVFDMRVFRHFLPRYGF